MPMLPVTTPADVVGTSHKKQKTQSLATQPRVSMDVPTKRYTRSESSTSDVNTVDGSASELASVSSARESHVTDDSELASRATASTSSGLGEAQFNIKDSYPGVGDVTASMGDVVHAKYIICLRDGTAVVTHKDVPVRVTYVLLTRY